MDATWQERARSGAFSQAQLSLPPEQVYFAHSSFTPARRPSSAPVSRSTTASDLTPLYPCTTQPPTASSPLPSSFGASDLAVTLFNLIDTDRDGRISTSELRKLLRALGEDAAAESDAVVSGMIAQADADGDGFVDLEEFLYVTRHSFAASPCSPSTPRSFPSQLPSAGKDSPPPRTEDSRGIGQGRGGQVVDVQLELEPDSREAPTSSSCSSSPKSTLAVAAASLSAPWKWIMGGKGRQTAPEPKAPDAVSRDQKAGGCTTLTGRDERILQFQDCRPQVVARSENVMSRVEGMAREDEAQVGWSAEEDEMDDELLELREAFDLFDRDGDGFVGEEELFTVLRRLWGDDDVTYEECEAIVANADVDGDGRIGFRDFVHAMSCR